MADWQRTLCLKPEWEQAKNREISVQTLAGVIAGRLAALRPFGNVNIDDPRDELVEEFRDFAGDPAADREDFDIIMRDLYDWADTQLEDKWNGKRVCWVDR